MVEAWTRAVLANRSAARPEAQQRLWVKCCHATTAPLPCQIGDSRTGCQCDRARQVPAVQHLAVRERVHLWEHTVRLCFVRGPWRATASRKSRLRTSCRSQGHQSAPSPEHWRPAGSPAVGLLTASPLQPPVLSLSTVICSRGVASRFGPGDDRNMEAEGAPRSLKANLCPFRCCPSRPPHASHRWHTVMQEWASAPVMPAA
jgi:hypothetical protein